MPKPSRAIHGWRRGGGAAERLLGLRVVVGAEVGPPQAGAQQQAEHGGDDELGVHRQARRADTAGDDRLADRDDDHQPVALDEVGGRDLEALWLSRFPSHGVLHSKRGAATVHSTACAVPPRAPPTTTSSALKRL